MNIIMTKEEFIKELKEHDWHYEMSDSMKVYDKGKKSEVRLRTLAGNFGWYKLYADYFEYFVNNGPKPEGIE